jgi:hypothetical protein
MPDLGGWAGFSATDSAWIEQTRRYAREVVSVSHPEWRGIRSSAREMFDNRYYIADAVTTASAMYYCRLFQAAGIRKLIINGFPLSHQHLVERIRRDAPEIAIYALWHGSFLQSGEDVAWKGFQTLLSYARNGSIEKLGFVKEGMAEILAEQGLRTAFVMNMVQRIPSGPANVAQEEGNSKLGLWNIDAFSWRKLPFSMIAAASAVKNCTLHLSGADQRSREFVSFLGVRSVISTHSVPQRLMPARLAEMHLNLYVTLSECAPMLPLESLSIGVPCLFGPNSHFFKDNEFLYRRLVVPYPDSAQVISKYIERALVERSDIVAEYRKYAPGYIARAKQSLKDFLDM